ncbi:MAG TPA: ATP-binding protein [Candidatus Aminicenantes bacterium]|nr:ATP-binding protein [Candidatus Aminicenantes bacterium]
MIPRPYWLKRIREAWQKRPIVWLAGVRRVGKTTLAKMLSDTIYLNCDLPSDARRLEDSELFFRAQPRTAVIVLDEVHKLADPSRVLKIAADGFSGLRILATGSSTLAATRKFRDALTGRKQVLQLTPVLWTECEDDFGVADLDRRLHHGGLPEFLLSPGKDETLFSEWLESFYARDIQELFAVRERTGFLNLFRLMLRTSGGLADYTTLAKECDISRQTVKAYLEAMSVACALSIIPPYHGGGPRELLKRPKVYGFDTGFVTYARGWQDIRDDDRGLLWEHLILDTLRAATSGEGLFYWRDKSGREVDFVLRRGRDVDAFECKINPDRFDPASLAVFRAAYPRGRNTLVCPGIRKAYERRFGAITVRVAGARDLLT